MAEGLVMAANPPVDRSERDRIVQDLDTSLLVEAAAGTGKTTSLVSRMVALLREGKCPIEALAAVTFTRKAAGELRARFQKALEESLAETEGEARDRLEAALLKSEQCFMGTIHSFCARLLRERPVEAGVDLAFEELDDDADEQLRAEAWDLFTAGLYARDADGLLTRLADVGLEPGQLRAAFLKFAIYPDVDLWPVPEGGLPDLRPAAEALEKYVRHIRDLDPPLPGHAGTDKLIPKYKQLLLMTRHLDLGRPAELMSILAECRPLKPTQKCWSGGKDQAKAEEFAWQEFCAGIAPLVDLWQELRYREVIAALAGARAVYDRLRRTRGQLSFQDLLMKAAALLRHRPHIRRYFRRRFTHLLVDEFQDTDPVQAEVMLLLTATDPEESNWRACLPVPGSLFVVGDPKQSIYRFRRADIVTYNQVREIVAASGGETISLQANFRSAEPIIHWVNGALAERFPKVASEQAPAWVPLSFARTQTDAEPMVGVSKLTVPKDASRDNDSAVAYEAQIIANVIAAAPADPSRFMIIARQRKHLAEYAAALQAQGIPHRVTGGAALNQSEELRLLYLTLEAVTQPENPVSLVAVLRSELFGVSDAQLYAFRKAGGTFHFRTDVPATLDEATRNTFSDTFTRLHRYARWLHRLPPVPATEKIVADLALTVRAAAAEIRDVGVGSLLKAIELLRAEQSQAWSVADLVAYLGRLARGDELHDGISARSGEGHAVQVMNLHKAKGLEAPVVFLADPSGGRDRDPEIYIDRSGDRVRGYLAITQPYEGGHGARTLAQPEQWEELVGREREFAAAESERLRYVAATRARSALVVTQRALYASSNPWDCFKDNLVDVPELGDPGPSVQPDDEPTELTAADVERAEQRLAARRSQIRARTYAAWPAKAFALAEEPEPVTFSHAPAAGERFGPPDTGEHGAEWGTLIHQLLEAAMRESDGDLSALATTLMADLGLSPVHHHAAVLTVERVMKSGIWQRAQESPRRYSEVPFQLLADRVGYETDQPTVLRGAIDLVFQENGGWVVVDYKTETVPRDPTPLVERYAQQVQLYARAWEACTGEEVTETGIYFCHGDRYVGVERP